MTDTEDWRDALITIFGSDFGMTKDLKLKKPNWKRIRRKQKEYQVEDKDKNDRDRKETQKVQM
jgi:hypothetical protein